jgi:hypothetical protein
MSHGFPVIQVTSGSGACDEGEHTVTFISADFLLVFIHPDYDTTVASFQNSGDTPVISVFRMIDTVFTFSEVYLIGTSHYNSPTIILKSHHM